MKLIKAMVRLYSVILMPILFLIFVIVDMYCQVFEFQYNSFKIFIFCNILTTFIFIFNIYSMIKKESQNDRKRN